VALRRKAVVLCLILVVLALTLGAQWRHISLTNKTPEPAALLARDMLIAHNLVRVRVDVPPLRWSEQLAAHAGQWAEHLIREQQFYHRPKPTYGENLFEINGPRALPADVVGIWAAEAQDYNYRFNVCRGEMCGHYTQLVWKDTREVGCAVARDAVAEVWVCNYNPPGNWVGERPY
jgi:pathogenesis-related protein 1